MNVYCADGCHVWLGSSSLCTCEAHRGPSGPTLAMYGLPNYNPFGPPAPQKASQTDIPLEQFHAAQVIKDATHLSSDGERVYSQRMGNVRVYFWDDETKAYGSSFPCPEGLPADAVVLK